MEKVKIVFMGTPDFSVPVLEALIEKEEYQVVAVVTQPDKCPRMGFPHASPLMVWFTTAWKMDAARSSFDAPSLMRGWISDFANTPHRAAIE